MKRRDIWWAMAALAATWPLSADVPFSNRSLGMLEGTADFCAQSDPTAAAKYREHVEGALRAVPAKVVTDARGSQEYKDAYQAAAGALAGAPKEQLQQACTDLLHSQEAFRKAGEK